MWYCFVMIDLTTTANTLFPDNERKPFRVGVIAMASSGNCLSMLRSETQKFPNTWGTPGGKIDIGETPAQAAVREFQEETGGRLTSVIPLLYDLQGNLTFFTFLGFCDEEFTPVLDHEHTAFQWSPFDEWPQPPSPGMRSVIMNKEVSDIIKQHVRSRTSGNVFKPSP
jgi:8-oxo-dGTP pyrophosphatase MutT (NUDIX family)